MDNQWERINPAVDIDVNTADRLFKCFDQRRTVSEIELFSGGRSTTNYKISLKDSEQQFVLRIYAEGNRSWQKEFNLQKRLNGLVPLPEIDYLDDDRQIIDKPYAIVHLLDGTTLDRFIEGKTNTSLSAFKQIGETLAVIHQFQDFEKEGLLDENLNIIEGGLPILSWHESLLNQRAGERLGSHIKNRLLKFIKDNRKLLVEITRHFVFSHGDFRPANIMLKDGRLVGIMDWEWAQSAPPYFDVGQFIRYREQVSEEASISFIEAYDQNAKHPLGADWEKLAKLMDLVNLLVFLDNADEKPNLFSDMKNLVEKTLAILENKSLSKG